MNQPRKHPKPVPPASTWQREHLTRLEAVSNQHLDAQVYTDTEGVPTAAAGTGSIGIAGWFLAADLAAHTDHQDQFGAIIARHQLYAEDKLGPEAWPDVLLAGLLYANYQHLENAFTVTDGTRTDLRAASRAYWNTVRPDSADGD
ncbi:hypothetical protein DEJ34_05965 [Curtobacterium sp. MCPF17_050]|uniref:hypothetical protein n=1 Tax=Curtobacterium sp. MCPF17_050 TaxID=2175664 RepID=UPI0015E88AA2|nr:hypothetical protein [Curtobacterium sp. MCPF17_050]WIB16672.1 hypothetical protein DEJ34_05965 [Curtobacterium sp. MCPF17_050]